MSAHPPPLHQERFLQSLRFDQLDRAAAHGEAVREITGVSLSDIVSNPLLPLDEAGFLLTSLATLTVAQIRDHWDRLGEPERGERVVQAFAHSIQLPDFWRVASNRGLFISQMAVPNHPLRSEPGSKLMERPNCDASPICSETHRLFLELTNASSTADLDAAITRHQSLIASAAEEGDWHFLQSLGETIREVRSSRRKKPRPVWNFRIPNNNRRGKIVQFARVTWLSHLYWLMPTGLLQDPNLLDASEQQAKDLSRGRLPRADPPAIEHVRDSAEGDGDPRFRFGKAWGNGPKICPSDYPRET